MEAGQQTAKHNKQFCKAVIPLEDSKMTETDP